MESPPFAQLAVFVDVVNAGSFSACARRQSLAVSSVTRRIDQLEAQLGVRVLQRSTHAVTLTEAGRLLYERTQGLFDQWREVREALETQHTEPRGLIRLDAPAPFGRLHLMPAVAAFMDQYPAVRVELALTDSMVDPQGEHLGAGVDLALRIGPVHPSRSVATVLARQTRVLCASPAYLARRGLPDSVEALGRHDCLAWTGVTPPGAWHFGNRRQPPARPRFCSNHSEALLAAALEGLGIAHLPTWLVAPALADDRLRAIAMDGVAFAEEEARIHLLRQPTRPSARTGVLIEFLRQWFATPSWSDVS